MSRNILEARSSEVKKLSDEFQLLLQHYGRLSMTEVEQNQFMNVVEQALFDITRTFSLNRMACPPGYRACPGGGCVPQGRVCRDSR